METQVETKAVMVDVEARDVFVLVLAPHNLIDANICGRTVGQWVDGVAAQFAHRKVEIQKNDDIMTIVKNSVIDKKYCVVIYADTPLITHETIEQALSFTASYGYKAVRMPRGWIFETEYVRNCINIETVQAPNLPDEDFIVAYNFAQIALINTYMRARINNKHMNNGVYISDPYNVYIDADVKIGKGTQIGPNVMLRGECVIGQNVRMLNCVEVKKSTIGDGTTVKHMTYIGDATVGKNCSIGNGVVFCSYDGKQKNHITLGDKVFVGSNTNLVAPLTIGKNAYIAAGSTITQDVPINSLGIGRARQAIKENWREEEDD